MNGGPPRPERRRGQASPTGFLYDRLMPWLLAGLGLVLVVVVVLSVAAMLGFFPGG